MAFVRDRVGNGGGTDGASPTFNSAFGETITVPITPITQISAQYGLLGNVLTVTDNGSSGTTTTVDEKYTCSTGTAPDGLASILTRRQLTYKPGQGALARFTAIFSTGVPDSNQGAGLITAENLFSFGYIGETFGIVRAYDGRDELQELTLTVAGAAETVNVTINGVGYNVLLSGAGTVEADAYEIATSLSQQVPNYSITSNGGKVIAQAVISSPQAAFAYTGTTSTGSWSQIIAGAEANIDFTPQTSWNRDTRISPDPDRNLDPTKGNVYQIQFQYLGFGAVEFFVEDKKTGDFILVHKMEYANTHTQTSVNNPSFRVGWIARNLGNTSDIVVQGASAGAFIEGIIVRDTPPRSDSNEQLAIGTDLTNIVSFRNRFSFGGKVNRAELFPQLITGSTQSTKFAIFKILVNPTFGDNVLWEYINEEGSVMEVTKNKVTVSGGQEIGTLVVSSNTSEIVRLNEGSITPVFPGDTLCLAAVIPQGSASDCQAAMTWQEDL